MLPKTREILYAISLRAGSRQINQVRFDVGGFFGTRPVSGYATITQTNKDWTVILDDGMTAGVGVCVKQTLELAVESLLKKADSYGYTVEFVQCDTVPTST